MELTARTTEEYIIGAEKEMEFSIDSESHVIFEILRDKMYSDKIGAVAREVVSNSRDANREAGREDVPVVVEIVKPNKFASIGHQSIVFHDNGIGITPDRMADVFIKYASSTKRGSNNETGGFGLGAKTPFAYSDTFTVITVCDYAEPVYDTHKADKRVSRTEYRDLKNKGVKMEVLDESTDSLLVNMDIVKVAGHLPATRKKYTYNAIIDKSNKGKMILFETEDTTEETGTKIVVPIKTDSDRYEFEKKVISSTQYWGDSIVYKNFYNTRTDIEEVFSAKGYSILKTDSGQTHSLLIDGINYPLNKEEVGITDSGVGNRYTILMSFNTGELTISANREAVQYDAETIEKIKERYEQIKTSLYKLAEDHVSKLPSYLEACKFAFYVKTASEKERIRITDPTLRVIAEAFNPRKEYTSKATILSNKSLKIIFEDKEIKSQVKLQHHTLCYLGKPNYSDDKTDYSTITRVKINEYFVNSPFYLADAAKNKRRNETIWENNERFALVFEKTIDPEGAKEERKQLFEDFGIEFKSYKEVPLAKVERNDIGSYKVDGEVQVNYRIVFKEYRGLTSQSKRMAVNKRTKKLVSETPDSFCYFAVSSLGDMKYEISSEVLEKMAFVRKHTSKQVIVINETSRKKWISHTGMTTLEQEYENILKVHKAAWEEETLRQIYENAFYHASDWNYAYKFHEFADIIEPILPKVMQGKGIFQQRTKTPSFVVQNVKFDEEALLKKVKEIFGIKYPLLMPYLCLNVGGYSKTKDLQRKRIIVQTYIKSVS